MERRTHVIFGTILLLVLAVWWFSDGGHNAEAPVADVVATETTVGQPQTVDEAEGQRQFAALERDQQSYAAELSRREADQNQRARAGARTEEFRKALQMSNSGAWLRFNASHSTEYKNLRALAAANPHGTTPCTICNGRGSLDSCFLCNSSGKCPTCKGTGKLSESELCPTCFGTGKCYLCNGTGKMVCPFCDDGVVDSKAPLMSTLMPIN